MKEQFYITTPLYYVNAEPHIGHAYTTILADVLSRYQKLFGKQVHFLTGLDEHGQKVATAAAKSGVSPIEHCDAMELKFRKVWDELNIQYDDFIRTTEPRHKAVVTEILTKLYKQGDIVKREYEGWYSVHEERFFMEKDLVDGKDPINGRPVERLTEANYFFLMSKYQGWLIDYYDKHPDAVLPDFRLNEVKGFLRKPLDDLCISRPISRLSWGIPIPWDPEYVTYVWFDALTNYYSATVSPPAGKQVKWPAQYHIIAKDILTTHAVYWPIMLHAAGLDPADHILAHGYWLAKDNLKMSKSMGNVVAPLDLAKVYGTDPFRYVMMREMVMGQDASFSEELFVQRYNSDLANDLGNLFSRLAKVWNNAGYSPAMPSDTATLDIPDELIVRRKGLAELVKNEVEEFRLHTLIEEIMQFVRGLNKLIDTLQPWARIKTDPEAIKPQLVWMLDSISEIAYWLTPIMPTKMASLIGSIHDTSGAISPQVGPALFPRIKAAPIEQSTETPVAVAEPVRTEPETPRKPEITIDDFGKVELRVAKVINARKVKGSDKLLAVEVDLGYEHRQVVAGIAQRYTPEDIIGRNVIVVANLKPAKLRGEVSEGMILAVGDKEVIGLAGVEGKVPLGTVVR